MPEKKINNTFRERMILIIITIALTSICTVGSFVYAQGGKAEQFDNLKLKVAKVEKEQINSKIVIDKFSILEKKLDNHLIKCELNWNEIILIRANMIKIQTDIEWIKKSFNNK